MNAREAAEKIAGVISDSLFVPTIAPIIQQVADDAKLAYYRQLMEVQTKLAERGENLRQQLAECKQENAALNVTLFHVENGLGHPDERIRKLIEASRMAEKP